MQEKSDLDINEIAGDLYYRIAEETEKILEKQLSKLNEKYNKDIRQFQKIIYPDDPLVLATYEYNGQTILGVRINDTRTSIEFDIPELEIDPYLQTK